MFAYDDWLGHLLALDLADHQHLVEWKILQNFYFFSNRQGLHLPEINLGQHSALVQPEGFGIPKDFSTKLDWPSERLWRLLALAQHYGLPTRLLDWSFDYMAAAYFAASEACRTIVGSLSDRSDPPKQPDRLAVWVGALPHVEFLAARSNHADLQVAIVHAPRAENSNLQAQQGVFTLCKQTVRPHRSKVTAVDRRPLNEVLESIQNEVSDEVANRHQISKTEPIFSEYTLPLLEAPELMRRLMQRGYDATRVYPGYAGAAKAAEDRFVTKVATDIVLRQRNPNGGSVQ